jgi:acyl-CoA synthetase (AMP-forming)/AMP-acid ligase II
MHQAILARAGRNVETIKNNPLRFLRSSSASLPAQVMGELEDSFSAPVVEAYGMTEATHQMCCNRLDKQKPGSVGIPAGPSVKIAHEVNNSFVIGTGEVVISGDNVTPGYENNSEANQEIKQVVAFAVPHPKLGEEIAVAVVLSEGSKSDEKDIKGFAKERMADFKVPRKVVILDEIPKGATGKMQRIGMAEKLGLL